VHTALHLVVAFGHAGGAALVVAEPVDGFHEGEQIDIVRRLPQAEAARRSLAGAEQALARQLLKDLGEKVGWCSGFLGYLFDHDVLPLRDPGQTDKGADGVFSRA
jgi:hypothetical protein